MYVYFIRAGDRGAIKIGWTKDVEQRINDLQVGNAFKLNVLFKIPCDSAIHAQETERRLHKLYARKRIRGEWFMGDINFKKLRDVKQEHLREERLILKEQEDYDTELLYGADHEDE